MNTRTHKLTIEIELLVEATQVGEAMNEDFSCDDRGNVVDFYYPSGDKAATLDREAEDESDCCIETTWDGGEEVTAWAIANGYADEIESATKI